MQYHEIQMVGSFWMENLASLPVWVPADEGRLVYCSGDNKVYYGTSVAWVEVGSGGGGGGFASWMVKEFNIDGSNPPTQGTLGDGLATIDFSKAALAAVWFQGAFPEGYDPAKDLLLTLVFCMSTSEVGKAVRFGLKYYVARDGDSLNVAEAGMTTLGETITVPDVQYIKDAFTCTTLKIPASAIDAAGDEYILKLYRDPTDVGDTHGGSLMLVDVLLSQST